MMESMRRSTRPEVFDDRGRLLVFAAPLMSGFLGSPLALATARSKDDTPLQIARRNWAKRRAYGEL